MRILVQEQLNLLGLTVKDKITGIEGVVESVSFDLYGCVQGLVRPRVDKDGKAVDCPGWFDVSRFKVQKKKRVMELCDFVLDKGPAAKPIP